jgi:electron transfer flavoprotein beta subunit
MKILVCLKQILDPEVPARDFKVNPAKREAERGSASLVTDLFCENALETALQFRERSTGGDIKISVVSYGAKTAEDALYKAVAMKADSATLVLNDGNANPDSLTIARVLAAAAKKMGGFDVVLLGREAGDWGAAQVGGLLAEELGAACISFADRLELAGDKLRVNRQTDSGTEVLEAQTPVVLTVTNDEHNLPRIPKVRDTMMARRQPLTSWKIEDLGIDAAEVRAGNGYYEVTELFIPKKEAHCEFAAGSSLEEKVDAFAKQIAELAGVL